ncbi:cobyric acid synthase CobQ [Kyrpidia spormannii]|uniref:Cobyric acid synthase n=1 Tax=Kyrpidia spormannii TaxID=2055160 RepID=A0A2K8N3Z0_9BACL|nr:cobyric acid synthase [Kyrpidia spormannii]ATY84149.1 cobyric acid synthase CobQ [Kyrpidia spormannii]
MPRPEAAVSPPARCIMLQGTASNVGKSWLATGFCRVLAQDGWRVAPFKSQNMALNSYVTMDGGEIGRAQGVQAEAAGVIATVDMNPILLKPCGPASAQVILRGKPLTDAGAREYRERLIPELLGAVKESLDRLRQEAEVVVIEGAGSPAEINLKDRDIANMRIAALADAPVLLVGDIDRGGVFASFVGTLELLNPEERRRVKGFLINKFRGDPSLLEPGLKWLEARTGVPVIGVVPWEDLPIDGEDSLALPGGFGEGPLEIVAIRLPHLSNYTDLDPLRLEPDVRIRWVERPEALGDPDAVILPGTKNSIGDLVWLRDRGLAAAIGDFAARGGRVVGLCGGYQMLGIRLTDPEGIEGGRPGEEVPGLGLLPAETAFFPTKRVLRRAGRVAAEELGPDLQGVPVEGYEIHMGRTSWCEEPRSLLWLESAGGEAGYPEGAVSRDGKVWGTYVHGIFDSWAFRRRWLDGLRREKGLPPLEGQVRDMYAVREEAFDRLAALLRQHVDWERVYRFLALEPPGAPRRRGRDPRAVPGEPGA